MDGLSMAVHYQGERFQQAITRGDGRVGEDVTENARTIRSVPLRGEDARRLGSSRGNDHEPASFERMNADRAAQRAGPFRESTQCRGGCAARAGAAVTASRQLDFFATSCW